MSGHAQFKFVMTECSKTQIRLTGLKCLYLFVHSLSYQTCFLLRFMRFFLEVSLCSLRAAQFSTDDILLSRSILSFSDNKGLLWISVSSLENAFLHIQEIIFKVCHFDVIPHNGFRRFSEIICILVTRIWLNVDHYQSMIRKSNIKIINTGIIYISKQGGTANATIVNWRAVEAMKSCFSSGVSQSPTIQYSHLWGDACIQYILTIPICRLYSFFDVYYL